MSPSSSLSFGRSVGPSSSWSCLIVGVVVRVVVVGVMSVSVVVIFVVVGWSVGRSVRRRRSRRRDRASSLTSFFVTRLSSTAPQWNRNVGIPPFKDREHCLWPLVPRGGQEAPSLRALNGGFPALRFHRGAVRNGERQPATIASETSK